MTTYYPTIGLEIHAEMKTASKMWCGCANNPDSSIPNANTCEICMAHPGTLPVPNKKAIESVIKVGLACDSKIADFTEFDRKNYFYPDIPKAYQLTQYKYPFVEGGSILGVQITRIHLEEDTAKSQHDEKGFTLIDFNRAGVPLMELVTEPVIHDAKTASNFAKELQRILRYIGVSDAHMELGHMRVEANISISSDPNVFGTKVEVKNLNSFASVEGAIDYEIARHKEVIEAGGTIVQETRGWDENKQTTFSQRKKENAKDYRYFPDPDLTKMMVSQIFDLEKIKAELPELPTAARDRLTALGLKSDMVNIIIDMPAIKSYFDETAHDMNEDESIMLTNYLVADVFGLLKKADKEITRGNLPLPAVFKSLISMLKKGELSSRSAKDLLPEMLYGTNLDLSTLAIERGMIQKNDLDAVRSIVISILKDNPEQVASYKSGKEQMLMFFVGKCMKAASGSGNPAMFQVILREELAK